MTVIDDIENIIQIGGCVVMGAGVTPEKYRSLLEGTTNQDYLIIGAKDSKDADYIASKMSSDLLEPKSISVLGLEMKIYFIKSEKVNS